MIVTNSANAPALLSNLATTPVQHRFLVDMGAWREVPAAVNTKSVARAASLARYFAAADYYQVKEQAVPTEERLARLSAAAISRRQTPVEARAHFLAEAPCAAGEELPESARELIHRGEERLFAAASDRR